MISLEQEGVQEIPGGEKKSGEQEVEAGATCPSVRPKLETFHLRHIKRPTRVFCTFTGFSRSDSAFRDNCG